MHKGMRPRSTANANSIRKTGQWTFRLFAADGRALPLKMDFGTSR
jgi:hypothetical protein